jgi:hypothetical protein
MPGEPATKEVDFHHALSIPHLAARTLMCFAAAALVACAFLGTAAPSAEADGFMYFRDGVGASARVTTSTSGGMVKYKGRIWDRKGDGWHARIYGYSLGHPFGIRKATHGSSRTFSGEVPAPLFFEVCTFNGSTEITCTRKWTHN